MNHLMLDIETYGSKPDAVVVSVGMQFFDPLSQIIDPDNSLQIFPPVEEQIAKGRARDPDTMMWWSEQSLEAQISLLQGRLKANTAGYTLREARGTIASAVGEADAIWANGPDFDCVILRDFMGPDFKWPFWKHRCVRTFKNVFKKILPVTDNKMPHNALEDCRQQIAQVQAIHRRLREAGIPLE